MWPCLQDDAQAHAASVKRSPPRAIIAFIVGGSTYEEARAIAELNERHPNVRLVLGGSAVLNSDAFVRALAHSAGGGATTIDVG